MRADEEMVLLFLGNFEQQKHHQQDEETVPLHGEYNINCVCVCRENAKRGTDSEFCVSVLSHWYRGALFQSRSITSSCNGTSHDSIVLHRFPRSTVSFHLETRPSRAMYDEVFPRKEY